MQIAKYIFIRAPQTNFSITSNFKRFTKKLSNNKNYRDHSFQIDLKNDGTKWGSSDDVTSIWDVIIK